MLAGDENRQMQNANGSGDGRSLYETASSKYSIGGDDNVIECSTVSQLQIFKYISFV
jgi:hypothetical protein